LNDGFPNIIDRDLPKNGRTAGRRNLSAAFSKTPVIRVRKAITKPLIFSLRENRKDTRRFHRDPGLGAPLEPVAAFLLSQDSC
jgi:hypothetical protein